MKFIVLSMLMIFSSCTKSMSQTKPAYDYKFAKSETSLGKIGEKVMSLSNSPNDMRFKIQIFEEKQKIFYMKMSKLRESIVETITAKERGSTTTANYLEEKVYKKIQISKVEVDEFIKQNNVPAARINDQLKSRIKEHLTAKKKSSALDLWMAKKLGKEKVTVLFEKPDRPKFDIPAYPKAPSTGPSSAKVTVVEFSDFQCPACAQAVPVLNQLKAKYKGKVNFVYKSFPLDFHTQAKTASLAAMCVREQKADKFWDFHDLLFAKQNNLNAEDLNTYAKTMKIDEAKFSKCMSEKKYMAQINQDIADGKKAGVFSTPTFFVNGRIVTGALPFEQFSEVIEDEIKRK